MPFKRSDDIRPLQLVDQQPADALERSRRASLRFGPVNLTASPLYGVGGLGVVALALVVTMVVPGAWWVLLASVFGGVVLGAVLIAKRSRRHGRRAPESASHMARTDH